MIFYLQDASDGDGWFGAKTLAGVRVQAIAAESKTGVITASINPIIVAFGQTRGATTLNWRATGVTQVQVRVSSPDGPPMTGFESATGSATTGNWVTNGLTFYLQDASDGNSSGSAKTLSTVQVTVLRR